MVATQIRRETQALCPDDRWHAVVARDKSRDGVFVYGVRSTGVYCRPSCASRLPRYSQVVFFPVPELAEQAGFRPCKRCQPNLHPAPDPQLEIVRRICQQIERASEGRPTLAWLGRSVGISPYHLQKLFKRIVGITPHQYAGAHRLGTLKDRLKDGWTVTDALYDAGYGSSSRLYEKSSAQLGMTPATYRRGGAGLAIRYAIADSHVGYVLAAATERGVCAIYLGDSEASLQSELRSEYPSADIHHDADAIRPWVEAILEYLSGVMPHLQLPLDVQGTAFQRIVWAELQRIPYGETRSYGQIAAALGRPKAARAVANACASNPTPLVIPCHRAVRSDGTLGGYRWGSFRKEALVEREKARGLSSTRMASPPPGRRG